MTPALSTARLFTVPSSTRIGDPSARPVAAFQKRPKPSPSPVISVRPSGVKVTAEAKYPSRTEYCRAPVEASKTVTAPAPDSCDGGCDLRSVRRVCDRAQRVGVGGRRPGGDDRREGRSGRHPEAQDAAVSDSGHDHVAARGEGDREQSAPAARYEQER